VGETVDWLPCGRTPPVEPLVLNDRTSVLAPLRWGGGDGSLELFEETWGGPMDAVYWVCVNALLGEGDEGFGDPADELAALGVVDPGIPGGSVVEVEKAVGGDLGRSVGYVFGRLSVGL